MNMKPLVFGLCRVKVRLTCCEAGKWQTLHKPFNVLYFGQVEGLAKLARLAVGAQNGVLAVLVRPWKCPKAKLDGNLAAKVAQDGPKRGQEGPR